MTHMSAPSTPRGDLDGSAASSELPPSYAPPTYASFSPAHLSSAASAAKRRSTILVHQKSPLLLATPPQITRALAYSHPFLLPLNKLAGLLSWTTADPWESFLLLVAFWAVVQYGDVVLRYAGPIVFVVGIICGMYGRRYSPLSSSGWAEHPSAANTKDKKSDAATDANSSNAHRRGASEATSTRHQKTLDEIVDTLKIFTSRCNILLEPLLEMTDFLSTQRTATSATTRPALTTLFLRILAVTPLWVILTLPPLRIITTKRVVLVAGTLFLTWHSRVCRVSRVLLWRSATIRQLARWITGLEFEGSSMAQRLQRHAEQVDKQTKPSTASAKMSSSFLTEALKRSRTGPLDSGVRFTFIIYENQRRWLGLGWTNSLFAYERPAWTDEHNNPVPPKDEFELPEVENGVAKWRWVKGSKWRVDGVPDMDEADYDADAGKMGWIFYDNKWQNGRRGIDGWGRWTRRRKWYRDAELVEAQDEPTEESPSPTPPALPARPRPQTPEKTSTPAPSVSSPEVSISDQEKDQGKSEDDALSILSNSSKSGRFRFPGSSTRRRTPNTSHRTRRGSETASVRSNDDESSTLNPALELEIQGHQRDQGQWGIGDEAQMGLE
ncbi:integral peroxisomal membrane peroxin-domain-containing protein [Xylariomycetidae sp. FL0641]|nr:integral peroxisomal membrane peroxin-domain-containing protein [Xylariomycetidae sp. FL0641]